MRIQSLMALGTLSVLAFLVGCRGGSTPGFDAVQEWGRLEKQALDLRTVRGQMDDLRAQLDRWEAAAYDPKKAAAEGLPAEPAAVLRERLDALRKGPYRDTATAFWDNLTLFLDRALNSAELKATAEAAKAVELYADESIALARETVREEGRYDRAVQILEQALRHAPGHAGVKEELEKTRPFLRLTRERFDRAEPGMTMPAIRDLCGVPAPAAIQERTEKGHTLIAWLYPREDGAWAALFFDGGRLYDKRWDAQAAP